MLELRRGFSTLVLFIDIGEAGRHSVGVLSNSAFGKALEEKSSIPDHLPLLGIYVLINFKN